MSREQAARKRRASVGAQWMRDNDSAPLCGFAGTVATPNLRLRVATGRQCSQPSMASALRRGMTVAEEAP